MRSPAFRSIWLPAALAALVLFTSFLVFAVGSWLGARRMEEVSEHLDQLNRVHRTALAIQSAVYESALDSEGLTPARIDRVRAFLEQLLTLAPHLAPATPLHLEEVRSLLATLQDDPMGTSVALLQVMSRLTEAETAAHAALLARNRREARRDLLFAGVVAVGLPLLAGVFLWLARERFWRHLVRLRRLMELLEREEYATAPTDGVDPSLLPVLENYNHLVSRLRELERRHRERETDLESQVREAARALLLQQREVDRIGRLAAVGEVAATVAHEIRNPLAGMEVALGRLRREATEPRLAERLELIRSEVRRLSRQLDGLLDRARASPEPAAPIALRETLRQLVALARLQIPERIGVEIRAPDVTLALPEGGFRQAVLNLVSNAAQAIQGERPEGPGRVTVEATVGGTGDDARLELSVRDDGPGFPAILLEGGVRRFATFRAGGTGLGLATVRRFATDLGGELHLSNRQPTGACATLSLPLATAAA